MALGGIAIAPERPIVASGVAATVRGTAEAARSTVAAAATVPKSIAKRIEPWARIENSYSKTSQAKTYTIRWGSNAHHAKKFSNPLARKLVQEIRNLRIPINNWRFRDADYIHLWRK